MPITAKHVLVTGATGFLGHYLLAQLCRRTTARFRVLLRPPIHDGRGRLRRLLEDLGLDLDALVGDGRIELAEHELPATLDPSLLKGIDTVIHAAGSTCFQSNAAGEPQRTNVDGTRVLLKAAAEVGVRHFVLISTAYVCGRRTGTIGERAYADPPEFSNAYERSKWEGERLALRWAVGDRVTTICRPSILFGDTESGRATNFNGIYLIARATEILSRAVADDPVLDRHRIPLRIFGHPDATSNLVPVDWVAARVTDVLLDDRLHGQVHHLTNAHPPTHAEIKRWLEEHFDIEGGIFCGDSLPLDAANHYEDLFYSLGNVVRDYFRRGLTFESRASSNKRGSQRMVSRPDFLRSLRLAQACQWGRSMKALTTRPVSHTNVDPRWYFEEFLPWAVPRSTIAEMKTLTTAVRFVVDGDSCGEWVCRFDAGRLVEVHHGENGMVEEFGYRMSSEAFHGIVTGRIALQAAFFEGRAEMSGNTDRALRMVPIMSSFLKEFPVDAERRRRGRQHEPSR